MSHEKRPPVIIWILPLIVGLAGFMRVAQSPAWPGYRAVDIVQLTGSGACAGAALVGVIFMLRMRRGKSRLGRE